MARIWSLLSAALTVVAIVGASAPATSNAITPPGGSSHRLASAAGGPPLGAPDPTNRLHRLPPGVMPRGSAAVRAGSAPAGAHLTYYGGKVISHVKVIDVLYGPGTYTPEVTGTGPNTIAAFYAGITNSTYMDWLSEYNTTAGQNPAQTIGRGSYVAQFQIAPSAANAPTAANKCGSSGATIGVTDSQIQAELQAQITAKVLPAPDGNTYYAVQFPHNVSISQGGSCSGTAGGFCAYHGTVVTPSEFYYGVLPDFATTGMQTGCGGGSQYANESSVSSHELIEAATDAEVGIATVLDAPLAWYDQNNGEIGDICSAQQGAVTGGDGQQYTVQKQFSNLQNDCVVAAKGVNDFSITATPTSLRLLQGDSGAVNIATAVTTGVTETVSLSVQGQPAGATASLNPASVSSGSSSTLTVNAGTATPGTYSLTVSGTDGAHTPTVTVSLTVTTPSCSPGTGLTNPDFENGLTGWTAAGVATTVAGGHSCNYAARLGSTSPSTDSSVAQTFTASSSATGISLYYRMTCPDTVAYDWATVTLRDNTSGQTIDVLPKTCVTSTAWGQRTATVTAGHSYTLTLINHDDNYNGDPSYTLYDSVTLTRPGGAPAVVTNR